MELNLPIIAATRIIFFLTVIFSYRRKEGNLRKFLDSRQAKMGYVIKEIAFIGFGTISIYTSAILGLYSLIRTGLIIFKIRPLPSITEFNDVIEKYDMIHSPVAIKVGFIITFCIIGLFSVSYTVGNNVEEIMLPMRDGTRLSTWIYKPYVVTEPKPVILMRTPYNQAHLESSAERWAGKGYIVVTQDFRGLYRSEGEFRAFMSSASDGYDTCEWIVNQQWSNGKIGMTGASAGAINQFLAAGIGSPGLLCQQLDVGAPEIYDHIIFRGGKWPLMAETWIEATSGNSLLFNGEPLDSADNMVYEFLDHTNKTNWWANATLNKYDNYGNVTARALHFGGWFDVFCQGTIDAYMGYDDNGSSYAKDHQKLVIGPYTHGSRDGTCGELTFPNGSYGANKGGEWRDQIFTEGLEPTSIYGSVDTTDLWTEPNVLYYIMGDVLNTDHTANEWRFAEDWPVVDDHIPYYFHENYTINPQIQSTQRNFSYIFDPENPVPTAGGTNLVLSAGIYDQSSIIAGRTDIINFTTSTLNEPLEVIGSIKTKLFVSSNCTDTDFTAKLVDVYPNGYKALIADGILNMRKRNGLENDNLMTPHSVYEIEIDMWSTAYQFNEGHKLQVIISSSNNPKYDICPNTGAQLALDYTLTYDANNTILVGPSYNSAIYLPINSI